MSATNRVKILMSQSPTTTVTFGLPKVDTSYLKHLARAYNDLQRKLPNYIIPSAFVVLDAIPLTPNGKVDKRSLPTNDGIRPNTTKSFVAPRNFTELALVKTWENLLNTNPIGVTENFFDLGGHSFLAVRFICQSGSL
ncbi:phosphopantetheine-binding protein [Nostoc sp.]